MVWCGVVWCGVGWLEVVSVWGVWGVVGCGVPYPPPRTSLPRRPAGRRGFHTTARGRKRAHVTVRAFQNTTKIPREDPQREKKERKWAAGEGKKSAKFRALEMVPPFGSHPSAPTLRVPPPLRAPTFSGFGSQPLWAPPLCSPPFGLPFFLPVVLARGFFPLEVAARVFSMPEVFSRYFFLPTVLARGLFPLSFAARGFSKPQAGCACPRLVPGREFPGAGSSLRSAAGLEDVLDESCGGDVEDEVVPELDEKSRDNNKHDIFRLAKTPLPLFGRMWLLTAGPPMGVSVFFAQLSK